MLTESLSYLVTSSSEGGQEEKGIEATKGCEVTLAIDVSTVTYTVHTLSVDKLVVLKCHICSLLFACNILFISNLGQ